MIFFSYKYIEIIYIHMNSVFGYHYQNHIQIDNRIFSLVWFGFDQFGLIVNSVQSFFGSVCFRLSVIVNITRSVTPSCKVLVKQA